MHLRQLCYIKSNRDALINMYEEQQERGDLPKLDRVDPIAVARRVGATCDVSLILVQFGNYMSLFDQGSKYMVEYNEFLRGIGSVDRTLVDIADVPCQPGRPWTCIADMEKKMKEDPKYHYSYDLIRVAFDINEIKSRALTPPRRWTAREIFRGRTGHKAVVGPAADAQFDVYLLDSGECMIEYIPGEEYVKTTVLFRSFAWIFHVRCSHPRDLSKVMRFEETTGYIGLKEKVLLKNQWGIASPRPAGFAMSLNLQKTPLVCESPSFRPVTKFQLSKPHSFVFDERNGRVVYQNAGDSPETAAALFQTWN